MSATIHDQKVAVWKQARAMLARGQRPDLERIRSDAPREKVARWVADEVWRYERTTEGLGIPTRRRYR